MIKFTLTSGLAVMVSFALTATATEAQQQKSSQSPAAVLQAAQSGAGEIEQLRAGLRSPDASTRSATFTAMVNSGNTALIALAINEGHAAADPVLRDLSVRMAFSEIKRVVIQFSGNSNLESIKDSQTPFYDNLHFTVDKYDPSSGIFHHSQGEGQISGTRITFHSNWCNGSLSSVEGTWVFEGRVTCKWINKFLDEQMHISIR